MTKIAPAWFSPQTYTNCYKSYVVDVLNLGASYATPTSVLRVGWGDEPPLSQAECEASFVAAIFYVWVTTPAGGGGTAGSGTAGTAAGRGQWQVLGQPQTYGTWTNAGCDFAPFGDVVQQGGLVAGKVYRIAATARTPDNQTRKVRIETVQ